MLQSLLSPVRLSDLLRTASVELTPRGDPGSLLAHRFFAHTEVYVPFHPADEYRKSVETSVAIRRAGFSPVPHVAAREFAGKDALDDYLGRVTGEAGVERVLVVSGDSSIVRGPFASSLAILESGLLQRHGISTIDVGGHPEGNPYFARDAGIEALAAKVACAGRNALDLRIVTQFCFESAPIVDWLGALNARGIGAPVRVGLAGPATLTTLLKFALRCGIGNSLRALRPGIGRFGRLLSQAGPDLVVDGLERALAQSPMSSLQGFHFFCFGGLQKTSAWLEQRLSRCAVR